MRTCLKGYNGTLINVFVSSVLVTFLGMNWPLLYRFIINRVFYEGSFKELGFIFVLYLSLFLAEKFLQYIWKLSEAILGSFFLYDLRTKIYDKIFSMKKKDRERYSSGELLDVLNNDVQQIYAFIVNEGVFAVTCFVRLIMSIVYMYFINRIVAVFIITLVIINYILSKFLKTCYMKYFVKYKDTLEKYNNYIMDILLGLKDIRFLSAESYIEEKVLKKIQKIYGLQEKQMLEDTKRENANLILNILSEVVLYIVAAFSVFSGKMLLGDFVSLMIYYGWAKIFFRVFAQLFTGASKSFISIDRIETLLNYEDENLQGEKLEEGDIVFSNVCFSYGNKKVLKKINICIQTNSIVAIAGTSGTGKTTLINLLLKFYEPNSGEIFIGNKNIADISSRELREKVGVVNQNAILFNGSIKYNLLLGNSKASEEEMWKTLEIVHISDFIKTLPDGLDTLINGTVKLSTGQAQRIILARVLLKNPDIIILDEATSNIDEETERRFIQDVKEIITNKIVIIIAYRKKSLELAEKVFYLENGYVIDSGSPQELYMRSDGFKKLTMVRGEI